MDGQTGVGRIGIKPDFQYSFVLIDADGRLADWDEGFAQEWSGLRQPLTRGARYIDLLREVLQDPGSRAFMIENYGHDDVEKFIQARQAQPLKKISTREYTVGDMIISVEERVTVAGGIQRIARNVTDEHRARADLEQAQNLKIAADIDSSGVYAELRRSPEGEYSVLPISEEMRQLLSLPKEEVGKDGAIILARMQRSPEEIDEMTAALEESARSLKLYSSEFFIKDGNDAIRWMRHSLMPRREPDGTIVFSGVMRDITRAKEAEDQVEMLRSVVVRSFDSVLIMESQGSIENTKIIYANPKFEQLYGHSVREVVGAPISKLRFLVGEVEQARGGYEAVTSGELQAAEFEITHADGHRFWVEMRSDAILRSDDGRFRWVMISRDITGSRRAREDLVRAKNAAESANRAKGDFLANMSHELRTPLNAIIGFSELIASGVTHDGWDEGYLEYIQDIVSSGHHLLELINSVLDLSKIETGLLRLDIDNIDIDDLVRLSVSLMSGLAKDAQIKLTVRAAAEVGCVDGDVLKLKQVLLNVLSNAIKFTPEHGAVTVTLEGNEKNVTIAVADTGCGIPESELEHVTEPFVQLDSSLARRHPGTGLGLAIAKQICELHKGQLEISSVVDQGTIVSVTIPRSRNAG